MNGPSPFTNDITALGELLIDFTETGLSANGNRLFEQNPGGAPANLLVAASRLGCRTAFIGKVGSDMHGAFLKEVLESSNVSTKGLIEDPTVFTTLAFVALSPLGEREFSFARKPGADTCIKPDEVNYELIKSSRIFHFGSLSLTTEPARRSTKEAIIAAKDNGTVVTYDPNYRASLWPCSATAEKWMRSHIYSVDIMKVADNEMQMVTGENDVFKGAKKLNKLGVECVVVTLGADGAFVCVDGSCKTIKGWDVPVVDTTGAGDAFFGGFLSAFLKSGLALQDIKCNDAAEFSIVGNAVAALCIGKRGGIPGMPTQEEVDALMES